MNVERIVVWPRRSLECFLQKLFDIHNVFEFMPHLDHKSGRPFFFNGIFYTKCLRTQTFFAFEKFIKAQKYIIYIKKLLISSKKCSRRK